jgi:hypothetical protein
VNSDLRVRGIVSTAWSKWRHGVIRKRRGNPAEAGAHKPALLGLRIGEPIYANWQQSAPRLSGSGLGRAGRYFAAVVSKVSGRSRIGIVEPKPGILWFTQVPEGGIHARMRGDTRSLPIQLTRDDV